MDNATPCSLSDCTKPSTRAGYCYGHYMKNWRYGTPTPAFGWTVGQRDAGVIRNPRVDLTGKRFGTLVVLGREPGGWLCQCDCGRKVKQKAGGLNRGSTASCGDRGTHGRRDDVGYSAAHDRVRSDRGLIQTHDCIDCGRPAQHWSYDHTDPNELLAYGLSAGPVAYSSNPDHYSPRCVRCHKRFDLAHINAFRVI